MECEASQVQSRYLEDRIRYLDNELEHAEKDTRDLQLETKARDDLVDNLGGQVPVFGPISSWERVMDSGPHGPLL